MGSVILTKIKNRPGGFTDGLMTAVFGRFSAVFKKTLAVLGLGVMPPIIFPIFNIWPDIGLYSIWQACALDWTGFQSLLVVFVVGTRLPQSKS